MAFTKITAAGIGTTETVTVDGLTVINNGSFGGNLSVGGTLTYEDVTNVDSVGLITARNGIVVGSGITLSKDGDIFATGVTTSTTFVGALTGNVTGNISGGTVAGSTGTFTGDVDIADKIVHTGDTNTALRFPAADTITAETGGSERLRIASDGKIGINATSPDCMLHVAKASAGTVSADVNAVLALENSNHCVLNMMSPADKSAYIMMGDPDDINAGQIRYDNNTNDLLIDVNGGEKLRITDDGSMGFGTSGDPIDFVELKNSTAQKKLVLSKSNSGTADQNGMWLQFNNYGPGATGRADGTIIGKIHFYASQPTSGNLQDAGAIECRADGNQTGNNTRSRLSFLTVDSQTATERMRIDKDGNVGINETSPAARLHISSPASTTCELRLTANNTGSGAGDRGRINVYSALNDGTAYQAGYVDIDRSSGTDDIAHLLVALNDGSSVNERVRIHADGELEIKQGAEGQTVLSAVGNYASSGNVDIATFARSGGAVKAAVRYNDATTDMSFGTTSSHALNIMTGGNTDIQIQTAGHVLFNQTTTHVPGLSNTTVGACMEDIGSNGCALFVSRSDSISLFLNRNNAGQIVSFRQSGSEVGSISTNGNSLPSDRNFKKNITDLTLGLDFINTLKPSKFNLKLEADTDPLSYGLIAQDVEESLTAAGISKNSVALLKHDPKESESESDYNLDYGKLIPVLINAIKELSTKVAALEG